MLLNTLHCTGQSPETKNYPVWNVKSAQVEKPCAYPSVRTNTSPSLPSNYNLLPLSLPKEPDITRKRSFKFLIIKFLKIEYKILNTRSKEKCGAEQ